MELLTGALFFFCVHRWALPPTGLAWCGFSAVLIALAFIDWDTTLLPDDLTLPLLWAGVLAAALQWIQVPLFSSVMGAVAGYLSLWLVYWGFKLATGKEGMGTATSNCLPPWAPGLAGRPWSDHSDVLRDRGDCRYWAQSFQQLARGGLHSFRALPGRCWADRNDRQPQGDAGYGVADVWAVNAGASLKNWPHWGHR